jgi:pentatricopeptide repeat protein
MRLQGCTPEPRTYNTIIAACSRAGQPAAAAAVYERMLADGVAPTGTTYTSLISAHGKAGQVEEALRVYQVGPWPVASCSQTGRLLACEVSQHLAPPFLAPVSALGSLPCNRSCSPYSAFHIVSTAEACVPRVPLCPAGHGVPRLRAQRHHLLLPHFGV